ncbi:MAG: hypothetical protein CVV42_17830 [Candidatus Riflebacteria bacterium HGW-Riflebacteria-2]|nr:MAG: hypothetical protein CVV42_17830 [Candidatus Riflebacteria bacterium HGW-Riflebacteria-2]
MSFPELCIYALVASLILSFFIFMFWRTRRMHERQNVELVYQNSFTNLCNQLEKDLAGCNEWKIQNTIGSSTSLFIGRIQGEIVYDARPETGDIVRIRKDGEVKYPFKGERESTLKTMEFVASPHKANYLNLKVELLASPSIEFSHEFSVRVSVDKNKAVGFFENPELKERGAEAHIGKKQH